MVKQMTSKSFGCLVQDFFYKRLIQQCQVSPNTIASYKDTFRLLLRFAEQRLGKPITRIALTDFDVTMILDFLDYLELERHNNVRTRNSRLAAIRSFFHYAGLQEPRIMPMIEKVFAVPMKRFEQPAMAYLSFQEMEIIMETPDSNTWSGRRDRVLFVLLYNTGARVTEIVSIKRRDIENEQCTAVHLHGKGRKQRIVPLWKRTSSIVRQWLKQIDQNSHTPLLPNRFGKKLTRSGVEKQLQSAVMKAQTKCPSLLKKRISPHTIRHTTAMHLLQSGVDLSVIALWLGHESVETTHKYMQADLEMKRKALNKLKQPKMGHIRFKPSKDVLAFLDSL